MDDKAGPFIYAIRDGEGYWFRGIVDGEAFFVSPLSEAKRYGNAAKALTERDALEQLSGDDDLSVRQVGPAAVVISRGELGDEHRINLGATGHQP